MGPNYSISTACATSNFCILNAANHIRRGEAVSIFIVNFFTVSLRDLKHLRSNIKGIDNVKYSKRSKSVNPLIVCYFYV